jgi:galactokinase/mevalonate kinase-like predicted kinase
VIINNQPLVDYLYNLTIKDEETLELEKRINQELEILNKLRDEARSKYNRFNRMNEVSTINTSAAAASSSAAGAGAGSGAGGGGRIIIKTDPSTNSYVVDNYIDNYLQ